MRPRPPAPGALGLVEEFLRTRNEVTDAAGLLRWRAERGLPAEPAPLPFDRAVRLREALRALLAGHNGLPLDPAAVEVVNAEIAACGLRPALDPDTAGGLRWLPGEEADALAAAVLAAVLDATADGTWRRMKACAAGDCRYAFYDHTRNGSGRWCDVSGCGANARMRAYRRRHAG
ncbi:MAG: CGNR zinc finger domain-containing protein [Mycobacteriales bacterium]